jgi:peptidoglycan-N-acetylglucosamine deacetylase
MSTSPRTTPHGHTAAMTAAPQPSASPGLAQRRRHARRWLRSLGPAIAVVSSLVVIGSSQVLAGRSEPVAAATTAPPPAVVVATPTAAAVATIMPTPAPTIEPTLPPNLGCATPTPDIAPAAVVRHGDREDKVVALTFDDGWDPENVERILRILQREQVNATFFPTGRAIKQVTKVWQAVADAGFPIANHTAHHPTLVDMCFGDQLEELRRDDEIAESTLGIVPLPIFRPPFGLYDDTTLLAAAAAGKSAVIIWDVDTRDWAGIGTRTVTAGALGGKNGSIVVMHTTAEATAWGLPDIIAGYRKRGFSFATVGQLLDLGGPVPFPITP